jgi:hypothetical protein
MLTYDLTGIRDKFTKNGIMICFNGPFFHSIIEEIGNAIRKYLENEEVQKGASTDVFAVYIEQAQNVRNYLAEKNFPLHNYNSAVIVIAKQNGRYVISSGNVIEKADSIILMERLEYVNSLDKNELKKLYREQMRRELPPGSKGAGAGLIDIARRSSEKLSYLFDDIDEYYNFFSLTVVV